MVFVGSCWQQLKEDSKIHFCSFWTLYEEIMNSQNAEFSSVVFEHCEKKLWILKMLNPLLYFLNTEKKLWVLKMLNIVWRNNEFSKCWILFCIFWTLYEETMNSQNVDYKCIQGSLCFGRIHFRWASIGVSFAIGFGVTFPSWRGFSYGWQFVIWENCSWLCLSMKIHIVLLFGCYSK